MIRLLRQEYAVYFHCCVTDGLFSVDADGVNFHGIEAITKEDLQRIQPTQPPEISPARAPPQWDEADVNQDIYEY
jgi:hypothetical protein